MKNKLVIIIFIAAIIGGIFIFSRIKEIPGRKIENKNMTGATSVLSGTASVNSGSIDKKNAKAYTGQVLYVNVSNGTELQVMIQMFKRISPNNERFKFATQLKNQKSVRKGLRMGSVSEFLDGVYSGKQYYGIAFLNYHNERYGLSSFKPEEKSKIRKIVLFSKGSVSDMDNRLLIRSFGLDPDKTDYTTAVSDADALNLLKQKKADMAIVTSVNGQMKKDYTIYKLSDRNYLPFKMIYGEKDILKKNKAFVKSLLKDMNSALIYLKENKKEAQKVAKNQLKLNNATIFIDNLIKNIDSISYSPDHKYIDTINSFISESKGKEMISPDVFLLDDLNKIR